MIVHVHVPMSLFSLGTCTLENPCALSYIYMYKENFICCWLNHFIWLQISWVSTGKEVLITTDRIQLPHAVAPYPDLVSVEHAKGHATSIHKLMDSERLLLPTLTRCVDQLYCPLPGNNKVSGLVLGRE